MGAYEDIEVETPEEGDPVDIEEIDGGYEYTYEFGGDGDGGGQAGGYDGGGQAGGYDGGGQAGGYDGGGQAGGYDGGGYDGDGYDDYGDGYDDYGDGYGYDGGWVDEDDLERPAAPPGQQPEQPPQQQPDTSPPPPPPQTPAATAGRLIRGNRVTFSTTHVSGRRDNANAQQNITDTAAGRQGARSNYGNAPGGTAQVQQSLLGGLENLSQTYTFNVSELLGGSHGTRSRHYVGVAADINTINGRGVSRNHPDVQAFMNMARRQGATEVLGPGSPGHNTHVHIAWPRPR